MQLVGKHSIGWRARDRGSNGLRASGGARRRLAGIFGVVLSVTLTAWLVWAGLLDEAAATRLLNRFDAIHAFLGAGLTAAALYAALSVVSGVGSAILALAEAAPRLALGGAMMGVLPFAQAADPDASKPASGGATSAAVPEMQVGVYMGASKEPPSDVRLVAPDGTDLTLKDVVWRTDSFKPSPYYGARGIDWSRHVPNLGAMVDFTHAKATATRSQTVSQEGKRKGAEIPPSEPFNATFRKLEFTHGLNFLTLNGVFRAAGLHRRIIPYAGVGIGIMVPHVEAWRAGLEKKDAVREAQITGFAVQALGGIEWRIFKSDRRSVFTEYKVSHTTNDVQLKHGGVVSTKILVHQFILGGYFTPWRQAAAIN